MYTMKAAIPTLGYSSRTIFSRVNTKYHKKPWINMKKQLLCSYFSKLQSNQSQKLKLRNYILTKNSNSPPSRYLRSIMFLMLIRKLKTKFLICHSPGRSMYHRHRWHTTPTMLQIYEVMTIWTNLKLQVVTRSVKSRNRMTTL